MKKNLLIIVMLIISNLIFGFEENLKINEIEISGFKEVPVEVIEDIMYLKKGIVFEANKMVEDYINIKSKSYIDELKIYPEISNNGIKIMVKLLENEEAKEYLKSDGIIPLSEQEKIDKSLIIRRIEFVGNSNVSKDELDKLLLVNVGGYFSRTKILDTKNRFLRTGYFIDIQPDVMRHGDGVFIRYTFVENPKINGIKFEGNKLISEEELFPLLRTKISNIYNINDLRKDKESIEKAYSEKGYGLVEVSDMRLDDNANLVIQISEGIVREIRFKKIVKKEQGQRRDPNKIDIKTKDYVLEREVTLEVGKAFETSKFEQSIRNLFRLGYFRNVSQEIESIPGDPDGKIVIFLLDEQKTAQYNGTISYGSAIGLIGSMGIEDKNFKGKNQTLGLSFEIGENQRRTYELSFNDPWIKGTERLSYGWSVYRREYTDDDQEITKEGFRLSAGKGITDNIRVRLGTRVENVKEKETDDSGAYEYDTVSLIPSIVYDTRNNFLRPTSGFYASLSVEFGRVLKESNYIINELELRKYQKGIFDKNIFAYRTVFGVASDNLRDSQKFRVGGGSNLRGYDYGDFKGNYQFYANLENRTNLDDNFDFVLFFDIGRAWDQSDDSRDKTDLLSDIKYTYGVGLRIQTPLGPLRFDYGWPMNDNEKQGGQFYFNIGHLF